MLAKARVLAWLLTALACFLVGALAGEAWSQPYSLPAVPAAGVEVAVAADDAPTATPEPTRTPTPVPTPGARTARDRPTPPDRPWEGLP